MLLGRGDGAFDISGAFNNNSQTALSITVGDFNADGKRDLAANDLGNDVSLLLGRGDATFDAAMTFTVLPHVLVSILVGELNSDGKQDLATGNVLSDNVSVLPGLGDGSFGPASIFGVDADPLGKSRPVSVAVGHLNATASRIW